MCGFLFFGFCLDFSPCFAIICTMSANRGCIPSQSIQATDNTQLYPLSVDGNIQQLHCFCIIHLLFNYFNMLKNIKKLSTTIIYLCCVLIVMKLLCPALQEPLWQSHSPTWAGTKAPWQLHHHTHTVTPGFLIWLQVMSPIAESQLSSGLKSWNRGAITKYQNNSSSWCLRGRTLNKAISAVLYPQSTSTKKPGSCHLLLYLSVSSLPAGPQVPGPIVVQGSAVPRLLPRAFPTQTSTCAPMQLLTEIATLNGFLRTG